MRGIIPFSIDFKIHLKFLLNIENKPQYLQGYEIIPKVFFSILKLVMFSESLFFFFF